MDPKEPVFVDGRLFDGVATYNRYKGVGWESGRTASVTLKPPVRAEAEVFLVDLRWGRIRKCRLDAHGKWEPEVEP